MTKLEVGYLVWGVFALCLYVLAGIVEFGEDESETRRPV